MALTISNRYSEAKRRPGRRPGVHAGQRIRELPIFPDVVAWIQEGHGPTELVRRIQANGFLEEVDAELLRKEVDRFAKTALDPADVIDHRQRSSLQRHAAMVLETSLGEMLELGDLYRMMKAILCEVIGMPPGPGTIGCVDGCPPLPAPNQPGDQCPGEPFEPGPESPEFRPKDFTQVRELLAEMRQIIRAHAALRQRLDELGAPKERISDLEARLVGVVHRRFAGRQDVQEALLDPQRRTKILSLLHRFVTSQRSQEAAAAALGDGRPDQPGDPP